MATPKYVSALVLVPLRRLSTRKTRQVPPCRPATGSSASRRGANAGAIGRPGRTKSEGLLREPPIPRRGMQTAPEVGLSTCTQSRCPQASPCELRYVGCIQAGHSPPLGTTGRALAQKSDSAIGT